MRPVFGSTIFANGIGTNGRSAPTPSPHCRPTPGTAPPSSPVRACTRCRTESGCSAPQLVADVLRRDRRLSRRTPSAARSPCALRMSPRFTSARRMWPCASRSASDSSARSSGSRSSARPSAMIATPSSRPSAQALDDRAGQRVDDGRQANRPRKLLRDDRDRGAGGLADAQRQVAGRPAHRDDEVPSARRLGIDHQRLDDARRHDRAPSGSRTCRCARGRSRSLSIVFGTCTTRMRPAACFSMLIAENAVSSPPIVTSCVTLRPQQGGDDVLEQRGTLRRVRARRCR